MQSHHRDAQSADEQKGNHPCLRFAAMVAKSTLIMHGLMYLNTYQ